MPQCGRCVRTGRECTRGKKETKFRQAKGRTTRTKFPSNQVWLRPPPRGWILYPICLGSNLTLDRCLVDFVLESGSDQVDNLTEAATNVLSPAGSLHSHAGSIPILERLSPGSSHTAPLPQYGFSNYQVQTRSSVVSPTTQVVGTPERSSQRPWPLRDPEEASLLQHFVDNVARFVSTYLFFFES